MATGDAPAATGASDGLRAAPLGRPSETCRRTGGGWGAAGGGCGGVFGGCALPAPSPAPRLVTLAAASLTRCPVVAGPRVARLTVVQLPRAILHLLERAVAFIRRALSCICSSVRLAMAALFEHKATRYTFATSCFVCAGQ
jgi:hypothetical protein